MRPVTEAEVRAINRAKREGFRIKEIAGKVERSSNTVRNVLKGKVAGKNLKIHPMDRVDIHAWWCARQAIPTMAQMARKYGVTHQYIRNICYEMDEREVRSDV